MTDIYFATTNKKKVDELSYYLDVDLIQLDEEINEIQGTEEEIAIDKLYKACKLNENNYTIIDDCSLWIKGLGTFPGPYFKDFLKIGLRKIDEILEKVGRIACTRCILGIGRFSNGKFTYKLFKSVVEGHIIKYDLDDENEKCFDDLFVPDKTDLPYTAVPLEDSRESHHRGVASKPLKIYIENELNIKK